MRREHGGHGRILHTFDPSTHRGGGLESDTDPELHTDGEEGNSASGSLASLAIMPEAVLPPLLSNLHLPHTEGESVSEKLSACQFRLWGKSFTVSPQRQMFLTWAVFMALGPAAFSCSL